MFVASIEYRPNFRRNSQQICMPRNATIVNAGQKIGRREGFIPASKVLVFQPFANIPEYPYLRKYLHEITISAAPIVTFFA